MVVETTLDQILPSFPNWRVDWVRITEFFPEVAALKGTPHDPVFHAEGCPWEHTRLVCEALVATPQYRSLPQDDAFVAFMTAVLHDIGKPGTAVENGGRISHPGHSRLGARMARTALWRYGISPRLRERVCAAIAAHQAPFWLLERDWYDVRRSLIATSLTCGNSLLADQAYADAKGRVSPDVGRMLESVDLFRVAAEETGCLEQPFPFADGPTLKAYMASPDTIDPVFPLPQPIERPMATVMSGLPGSGKSTWLAINAPELPVISLDAIREELSIPANKPQGAVVAEAKERARSFLRTKQSFAWDGTNLSRDLRGPILALCHDYGFMSRLVVTEATPDCIRSRFKERDRGIPLGAFERMLWRWEHPAPWEADELTSPAWPAITPSDEPVFTGSV